MNHHASDERGRPRRPLYTGLGLAIGAGLGMIVGLMMFDHFLGGGIGAAVGLIIGAIVDARR